MHLVWLTRHGPSQTSLSIDRTLLGEHLTPTRVGDTAAELDDLLLPWELDLSTRHQLNHPELEAHIDRVGFKVFCRATDADL